MSDTKKKFVFLDTVENHARLKIRLMYDGLGNSEFFRLIMAGYLDKDENILKFIEAYKEKKSIHNKEKRKKTKKMFEERKETVKQFGLEDSDIDNIFDTMEKEHPDL